MKLFYRGDCLRFLKFSRISQRQPKSLGYVILTASPHLRYSKCKHTGTCFSATKKNDRPLFEKWKTTRPLDLMASNFVLRYYSTGEKDAFAKDVIVQEFLKDIKNDFENEFKSCVEKEYTDSNDLEEPKLEENQDRITDKKNYYCEPLIVPSLGSSEEITNKDFSSSIDESEEFLSDDEEEDDIEDFIDYGYMVEDEDDDTDVQLYTPPIELKSIYVYIFLHIFCACPE